MKGDSPPEPEGEARLEDQLGTIYWYANRICDLSSHIEEDDDCTKEREGPLDFTKLSLMGKASTIITTLYDAMRYVEALPSLSKVGRADLGKQ